jgi:hypothetical protein
MNREYYGESVSDIDHDISEIFEYGPKFLKMKMVFTKTNSL